MGAYQAGVFQAIYEADIEVSWVCGTSIGAVNGALIVGNPPERRVERLREFWETITTPQISFLNIPWVLTCVVGGDPPNPLLGQQDEHPYDDDAGNPGLLFRPARPGHNLAGRRSQLGQLL